MNSSTSSSDFRRFGLGFLLLAFAPGLGLFLLGVWLEPLAGDLTRIGGFSERDFGWRTPQIGFKNPLPIDEGAYAYRDLWVLGDSFATAWPKLQWQNHLREKTGRSIGTLNINRISIDRLLQDPEFQVHPPKILIIESAERYLTLRLNETQAPPVPNAQVTPKRPSVSPLRMPQAAGREPLLRSQALSDVQIPFAGRYLLRSFQREILRQSPGHTLRLKLSRDGLFSSRRAQELLVFEEDLQKERLWRSLGVSEITARLERLRARVEANGVTRLVVLIAPDKLTAYRDVLNEPSLRPYTELSALISSAPNLIPDTAHALEKAIHEGIEDVYLPDDTHWGSSGQERVALTLFSFLKKYAHLSD